jgi:hypothetical protein
MRWTIDPRRARGRHHDGGRARLRRTSTPTECCPRRSHGAPGGRTAPPGQRADGRRTRRNARGRRPGRPATGCELPQHSDGCVHALQRDRRRAARARHPSGAIASSGHRSTLAFSETGSYSHFWAPLGTAGVYGDHVVLKRPQELGDGGRGNRLLRLVEPARYGRRRSVAVVGPIGPAGPRRRFDGLGLRGNASSPVLAADARLLASSRLGLDHDGAGLDYALASRCRRSRS